MALDRNILLAVRIGKASLGPVRTAAWLAKELGGRVTLLYVAVELETAATVASSAGLDRDAVRERMRDEARERATALATDILDDVPFETIIGEGDVAEEVAAVAARIGADLVVTGPQGRGTVTSIILGDTTRDILRHSPCPVVVVPPDA